MTIQNGPHNRFIEVKSYSDLSTKRFFWSRNEVEKAKLYREMYFIYLVDRSSMDDDGYRPEIIQDPYMSIFKIENNWMKECQSFLFTPVV